MKYKFFNDTGRMKAGHGSLKISLAQKPWGKIAKPTSQPADFYHYSSLFLEGLFTLCRWVFCLHVCFSTTCVLCPQKPEEGTSLSEPGLWVTVNQCVGARNQAWVFCRSNKCSSELPSLQVTLNSFCGSLPRSAEMNDSIREICWGHYLHYLIPFSQFGGTAAFMTLMWITGM